MMMKITVLISAVVHGRPLHELPQKLSPTTASSDVDVLLRDTKFIMTHDAATGLLDSSFKVHPDIRDTLLSLEDMVLSNYIRTQDEDLVGQLDCGARALDLRVWTT